MAAPADEEADEEPKLKYVRLGASVFDILQKDAATCMAVHDKFLALGTNWGVVYILDVNGNEIKRFAAHSACVNELCIEDTGECTYRRTLQIALSRCGVPPLVTATSLLNKWRTRAHRMDDR
jgi:hypothetical protein